MFIVQLIPYLFLLLFGWLIAAANNAQKASNILVVLLGLFVGCRYAVGWDYWNYTRSILNADLGLERFEWIPRQVGYLAHYLDFPQLYFLFTAFFSMFFSMKAIKRLSLDFPMSIYIFITFPLFFLNSLIIDRFFLAQSLIFYSSTVLFKEGKILPFVIGLFVAVNIHIASIAAILFLILRYIPINNKINVLFFVSSFVLNTVIIDILVSRVTILGVSDVFANNANNFLRYAEAGHSSDMDKIPILFYVINIVNLLFQKQLFQNNDKMLNVHLTIFNIGCCLMQLFSFEQNMSSRFSVFFLLYFCFIVPFYKNRQLYRLVFYGLGFLLFIYALTVNAAHPDFVGRRNCYLPYNVFFLN